MIAILIALLGVLMISGLIKSWRKHLRGQGVSILVPFLCNDPENQRMKNWEWLRKYWKCHLSGAEIIIGVDHLALETGCPFSKSAAVNDAASRAKGDVFVIVDADGFVSADVVLHCVKEIREAERKGHRLWFVPYRQFFRLTEEASARLLRSDPCHPYQFPDPPDNCDIQNTQGSQYGHWYGAGIQIMPRTAFEEVGGWDERFRGWGGEDHAAMRAMDTLYWWHKTADGQFLHIWHPMFSTKGSSKWVESKDRIWGGQTSAGSNNELSGRYYSSYGDKTRMRKLVNENRKSDL